MKLETPKIVIQKSKEELFNYLSEAENFKTIMPDGIEQFKVLTEKSFLFQLLQ